MAETRISVVKVSLLFIYFLNRKWLLQNSNDFLKISDWLISMESRNSGEIDSLADKRVVSVISKWLHAFGDAQILHLVCVNRKRQKRWCGRHSSSDTGCDPVYYTWCVYVYVSARLMIGLECSYSLLVGFLYKTFARYWHRFLIKRRLWIRVCISTENCYRAYLGPVA